MQIIHLFIFIFLYFYFYFYFLLIYFKIIDKLCSRNLKYTASTAVNIFQSRLIYLKYIKTVPIINGYMTTSD